MSPARRQAGFSLIEVIVALAIVGLALGATAGVFGNALLGHETAADVDQALALAEAKLAEAEATPVLRPNRQGGEAGDRFEWQRIVALYDDPDALSPPLRVASPSALRLFRIEVTVAWRRGLRQRQITLATLRLGSNPP